MGTPLGDFVRAKRDSTRPEDLGLPARERRRAPGLRRMELAERSGISVEYLTRIEQGRDRTPSNRVVRAIADALALEPGIALVTNRLGDVLASTDGFELTARLDRHLPPPRVPLRVDHPVVRDLRWHRETLELPEPDAQ